MDMPYTLCGSGPWRKRIFVSLPLEVQQDPIRYSGSWLRMAKSNAKPFLYLLVITALFYWKTLLTAQFSLLTGAEGVNQAYSWLLFWIRTIRSGEIPLWDSFVYSGRSFLGEMQTAAFDPLHLPFLLARLDSNGLLPLREYHIFIAAIHFLACYFFYLMARELGRSTFASLLAGLCFGLGGIVGELPWPHMLESAIWLPLLFLFLVRGFRADHWRAGVTYGALAGLMLGLSTLAGGFHLVLMQGLAIISVGIYYLCAGRRDEYPGTTYSPSRVAAVALLALLVGFAAGAVQLLPSAEYGARALRWFGTVSSMSNERIPYLFTDDNRVSPLAFLNLLFPHASAGASQAGEVWSPYLSVFGLVLIVVGIWKNWSNLWVRYFGWLALAGFLYALGSVSLLNGLAYTLIPKLWMARESTRFMYLVHFGLCGIVAFGCDTLLFSTNNHPGLEALSKIGRWVVAACLVGTLAAALWTSTGLERMAGVSVLLICLSFLLIEAIRRGSRGRAVQFLIVCLVMFDLAAFAPQPAALAAVKANGTDYLETLRNGAPVCWFLKSLHGVFRVDARSDSTPNFGDAYGVQENKGAGVTFIYDYFKILPQFNLLNEKYILQPASVTDPNPVYQDAFWRVYANPSAFPKAWLVHQIWERPTHTDALSQAAGGAVDMRAGAIVTGGFPQRLDALPPAADESVSVTTYRNNSIQLEGRAAGKAMLVLSENFYPGWHARVNGVAATIYQVDGALRGIVVPAGNWKVEMYYSPASVWLGAVLTIFAFADTFAIAAKNRRYLARASFARNSIHRA